MKKNLVLIPNQNFEKSAFSLDEKTFPSSTWCFVKKVAGITFGEHVHH